MEENTYGTCENEGATGGDSTETGEGCGENNERNDINEGNGDKSDDATVTVCRQGEGDDTSSCCSGGGEK